jgi:hypothetical protein
LFVNAYLSLFVDIVAFLLFLLRWNACQARLYSSSSPSSRKKAFTASSPSTTIRTLSILLSVIFLYFSGLRVRAFSEEYKDEIGLRFLRYTSENSLLKVYRNERDAAMRVATKRGGVLVLLRHTSRCLARSLRTLPIVPLSDRSV